MTNAGEVYKDGGTIDAGDDVSGKGTSGEETRFLKEAEVMTNAGEVYKDGGTK